MEPALRRALLAPAPTPELEATMITAVQKLFEGGKLEGRLEGKLEGEAAMLASQLEVKFGVIPEQQFPVPWKFVHNQYIIDEVLSQLGQLFSPQLRSF